MSSQTLRRYDSHLSPTVLERRGQGKLGVEGRTGEDRGGMVDRRGDSKACGQDRGGQWGEGGPGVPPHCPAFQPRHRLARAARRTGPGEDDLWASADHLWAFPSGADAGWIDADRPVVESSLWTLFDLRPSCHPVS